MPFRPTLLNLVAEVRDLIGDQDNGSQKFNNLQIQNALDESRSDPRYEMLTAAPTITKTTGNTAQFVWIDYYSKFQYWEIDAAVVQWGDYTQRTALASEFIVGHWQFVYLQPPGQMVPDSQYPGQIPPLYVTGRTYDIYAAAVKLLKMWKADIKTCTYDFSTGGQSFRRGTILQTINELIADYSRQMRFRQISLVRCDSAEPYTIDADIPVMLQAMGDKLP
jgi:hypothetical protein